MSDALTVVLIIGGIPAAFFGAKFVLKGALSMATFITRFAKAVDIINYQLVPNEGESLVDKVGRIESVGLENQRALEMHILDHNPE